MNGGGSDPFYSDGYNMNSIRRRIEWKRQAVLDSISDGNIPEICKWDIPPEVPDDYMARADEIRMNAANTLKVYRADEQYMWCKAHASELNPKELKRSCIESILGYVTGLERAIAEDDLITMRRHKHPNRYTDSFERGVQEIEKLLSARKKEPQFDIFSAVPPSGEDEYEDENQEICM